MVRLGSTTCLRGASRLRAFERAPQRDAVHVVHAVRAHEFQRLVHEDAGAVDVVLVAEVPVVDDLDVVRHGHPRQRAPLRQGHVRLHIDGFGFAIWLLLGLHPRGVRLRLTASRRFSAPAAAGFARFRRLPRQWGLPWLPRPRRYGGVTGWLSHWCGGRLHLLTRWWSHWCMSVCNCGH